MEKESKELIHFKKVRKVIDSINDIKQINSGITLIALFASKYPELVMCNLILIGNIERKIRKLTINGSTKRK